MGNRYPQRYERRGPDHSQCEGTSFGLCACNCHYAWRLVAPELVRLRDGRVGVVDTVYKAPEWAMRVLTGGGISAVVDIGEPVLLDGGKAQTPDELAAFTRA